MSCLPNTPVAYNVLSATNSNSMGWVEVPSIITSALSQYYPITTSIMTFDGVAQTSNQHILLQQIQFEETAATKDDIKKVPLLVALYNQTSPTAPTSGAVYNPSTANLLAVVSIAEADYIRVSDTVHVATAKPGLYLRTGTLSTAPTVYAVVLSNKATSVTYAGSASGRMRIFTQMGTAY